MDEEVPRAVNFWANVKRQLWAESHNCEPVQQVGIAHSCTAESAKSLTGKQLAPNQNGCIS